MFVMKASRSSTSMARIRQWLVLLLRVLAIAVLIIAVSRPLIGGWLGWRFSGTPDTIVILLDRSATMGMSFAEGRNSLQQGLNLIIRTGKTTAPDARIILIDSANIKPKQVPAWGVLSEMEDVAVTQTAADIPSLYRETLDYLLKNMTGITEIWCLSDMQQSNWNPENSEWYELESKFKTLPQPVTFRVLAVISPKTRNRSLAFVRLINYLTADKKDSWEIVFDIISDDQTGISELPLVVLNNGKKSHVNVKINGETTRLRFFLGESPAEGKCSFGYIELPPDPNLMDNRCYFAFRKLNDEKVQIVSDNKFLGEIIAAAVYPELNIKDDKVSIIPESRAKDLNLNDIGLLVWGGDFPQGEAAEKIKRYLQDGGVAVFFPAESSSASSDAGPLKEKDYQWSKAIAFPKDQPGKVVEWDHSFGPLADTVSGSALPVGSLKILKRNSLTSNIGSAISVYGDGRPFLYRIPVGDNNGKLYFCSTLPLPEWSDLGEGMVMVPMLKRMMNEGARRFSKITNYSCGDIGISRQIPYEPVCVDEVTPRGGERVPELNTGIFSANGCFLVVNRPEIEDKRGSVDRNTVAGLFKDRRFYMFDESTKNDSAMQTEIWRWFMVAMFCFLIAESFLLTPKHPEEKGN